MPRVLLIDDDPVLLDLLTMAFEGAGLSVDAAPDGRAGQARIAAHPPDVVVSDVAMPGLDGFALCRELRAAGSTVPFVFLTSRDSEIDEVLGLELGADDYVVKPFSTRSLVARVRAQLRRHAAHAGGAPRSSERRVGRLALDPERLSVAFAGAPLQVTVTEFRLLEALTERPGVVLSREQLLARARGDDVTATARVVDTYVNRLRRKFEAVAPDFALLEAVIGAGYRWRAGDG